MASCGFQLRDSNLSSIERIHVTGDYLRSPLGQTLVSELQRQGVEITAAQPGVITLYLNDEHSSRRRIATSAQIDAAEYELRLVTSFMVARDGIQYLEDLTLATERVYEVDRSNLSGSHEEQRLLLSEMRLDLARQIIGSLDAVLRYGGEQENRAQ